MTSTSALGSPIAGSMLSGMAAKLSGSQVMPSVMMAPSLSVTEALAAKRASGSAPTVGTAVGAGGHMSIGPAHVRTLSSLAPGVATGAIPEQWPSSYNWQQVW